MFQHKCKLLAIFHIIIFYFLSFIFPFWILSCTTLNLFFFKQTKVDILEVISDALYSESETVMDSMAELFDTLLRKHEQDTTSMEGFSVVNSFMQRTSIQSPQVLKETQQMMNNEQAQRETILAELITAVGLQRFRFYRLYCSSSQWILVPHEWDFHYLTLLTPDKNKRTAASSPESTWIFLCRYIISSRETMSMMHCFQEHCFRKDGK